MRVLLERDGDAWVANGLDVRYSIDGDSAEHAKARFIEGMTKSIESNVRVYGNADLLLHGQTFQPDQIDWIAG